MPSAIWTGSISFGLVQVPVRLVGATKSKDVSFNQLEEGTGARIRYKKVSEQTGEEVTQDRIKRGYEISKGRYVMVEPDELDALRPRASHAIDIEEFVDLDEIDPVYFEQPYYLVPDARGVKPYKLLADAMVEARAKVLDLVAALEASLEKAQTAKERHPSASAASAASATNSASKKSPAKKAVKQPAKKSAAKATKPAAKKRSA